MKEPGELKKNGEEEILKPDSALFRWNATVAPPWDPTSYYFFLMPNPLFYEASLVAFTFDHARDLHTVLSHFCTAAAYTGLHTSAERICNDFVLSGEEAGAALLMATTATQLIHHGLSRFLPEFLHVFIVHRPDEEPASEEEKKKPIFAYPVAPMHLWAFLQACDFLERDLLPIYEKNGEDIYPFGQLADVRKAVQSMREVLSKDVHTLLKGQNPYKQISDLRALGEMMEEEEKEEARGKKSADKPFGSEDQ